MDGVKTGFCIALKHKVRRRKKRATLMRAGSLRRQTGVY
ncbi:hypothetical protein SPV1_04318 [Mariprofundus ferrooxydans PV-1]|uniref:Uncharacterized protein n=1 Tax=Mariprofundus ferrooxydans PV-1 TaxID=314345 RepID=Q0F3C7_9PROT|nr:hypothetical protein SPV1_04318 [Mariprofundus ferrooxydans PV-1]